MTEIMVIEVSIPLMGCVVASVLLFFSSWIIGYSEGRSDKRKGISNLIFNKK